MELPELSDLKMQMLWFGHVVPNDERLEAKKTDGLDSGEKDVRKFTSVLMKNRTRQGEVILRTFRENK